MADDTAWDTEVPGDRERITLLGPNGSIARSVKPTGRGRVWPQRLAIGACAILAAGALFMLQPPAPLEAQSFALANTNPDPGPAVESLQQVSISPAAHAPVSLPILERSKAFLDPGRGWIARGPQRLVNHMTLMFSSGWSMAERKAIDFMLPGFQDRVLATQEQVRNQLEELLFNGMTTGSALPRNQVQWNRTPVLGSNFLAGVSLEP